MPNRKALTHHLEVENHFKPHGAELSARTLPCRRLCNQYVCWDAKVSVQFPDHGQSQWTLAVQDFVDTIAFANHRLKISDGQSTLNHAKFDGFSDRLHLYTPNQGFRGRDQISYTTTDAWGNSESATVVITVDDAPVLKTVALTTNQGQAITGLQK